MTISSQIFKEKKRLALNKLEEALKEKKVDLGVIEFINKINSFENYYTTSSCAGRFVILSKSSFRGKYTADFVFKTHTPPINIEQVKLVVKKSFENYLYINLEPPTFHICCNTLSDAIVLHQMAIDNNIGYSMFKTLKKSIVVEIRGTGMLQIPIGFKGRVLVNDDYLEHTIQLCNQILSDEQSRFQKFQNKLLLLKDLSEHKQ